MLNIPISYFLLMQNDNPLNVFYVSIIINGLALFIRILLVKKIIEIRLFFTTTLSRISIVSLLIFLTAYFIRINLKDVQTIYDFIIQTVILSTAMFIFLYVIGIEKQERLILINFIKQKIKNVSN
jgi:hypothetical protein